LKHAAPEIAIKKGATGRQKNHGWLNAYVGEINRSALALAATSQAGIKVRHQTRDLMADVAATSHEYAKN